MHGRISSEIPGTTFHAPGFGHVGPNAGTDQVHYSLQGKGCEPNPAAVYTGRWGQDIRAGAWGRLGGVWSKISKNFKPTQALNFSVIQRKRNLGVEVPNAEVLGV